METSAKNATNVEQAFLTMAAEIKNRFVFHSLSAHIYYLWTLLLLWFAVLIVVCIEPVHQLLLKEAPKLIWTAKTHKVTHV